MFSSAVPSLQSIQQPNSHDAVLKMTNSTTTFINSNNINNRKNDTSLTTNAKQNQKNGIMTCPKVRATTVLYRSECVKYSSAKIVWRSFTLQSTEIAGRYIFF